MQSLTQTIKQTQKSIIVYWHLGDPTSPDQYQFFNRYTIGRFCTKVNFFHWPKANRRLISRLSRYKQSFLKLYYRWVIIWINWNMSYECVRPMTNRSDTLPKEQTKCITQKFSFVICTLCFLMWFNQSFE